MSKTSHEGQNRLDIGLPGCGLPLNHATKNLFRNALNPTDWDIALPLITLRERTMLHLMDQLSDKPDWNKKVFDETIVSKWKTEALEATITGVDITQKMVDWCIAELRYKARIFGRTGAISVYTGDVVKSDSIIPKSLQDALKAAVVPLEDVPDSLKDWHPDSDEQVLDLVHPSLFPLIYGRTKVLTDGLTTLDNFIDLCSSGHTLGIPPASEAVVTGPTRAKLNEYSVNFQWLPCEVNVSGEHAKITSYINNLNPQEHQGLYQTIEQFISRAIPMWNMTLTPLKLGQYRYSRIVYEGCEYEYDPDSLPDSKDEDGDKEDEDEDEDEEDRQKRWIRENGRIILPEPGEFCPPSVPKRLRDEFIDPDTGDLKPEKTVDLRRDFKQQGLQVIVKLANIQLTPEKPKYMGGTWHVEGQLNEHICATALYYYDSANITTSRLAFRQQCSDEEANEIPYEQDDHGWLKPIFGVDVDEPTVQEVGAIETKEGRLITFPNVLQHQVQPFSLADPCRPGHRKILALFLVDPNIRIISTANVPCQRQDWWREAITKDGPRGLANLPLEFQDQVYDQVGGFPISMKEAKKIRIELMDERRAYVALNSKAFTSNVFSLCEH